METRASYLIVGLFVVVLGAALVGFAVWLTQGQLNAAVARYDIRFDGSVSGLQVGSSVSYSGVPVGEVSAVSIDPADIERVLVTIEIPENVPVLDGTMATLQLQGITGAVAVLLSGGTQGAAPLRAGAGQTNPEIPSRPSQLAQLLDETPDLVTDLSTVVNRAAAILSPQNQAALTATLENLALVSGGLADRMADIQTVLNDAAGTMGSVRDASVSLARTAAQVEKDLNAVTNETLETLEALTSAAQRVDSLVGNNGEDLSALIADARAATGDVAAMAQEVRRLTEQNSEPLLEFTTGTLVELTTFLAEARGLIAGLNRVTTQVERNPAGFLFGNQQQGYEVPQ